MNTDMLVRIKNEKIIAICRGIYGHDLIALARALYEGGVKLIEVTFDQSDLDHLTKTPDAIRQLEAAVPEMGIGVGTVVTQEQLQAASNGGARFVISPNTDSDIIRRTKELGLISIPGAMTPSEIVIARQAGADMVKLFPCAQLGVEYIKAIRAPLNDVPLVATGGIDVGNLEQYLSLGMAGAGIGGKLCNKKLIIEGRFDEITTLAQSYASIAAQFQPPY